MRAARGTAETVVRTRCQQWVKVGSLLTPHELHGGEEAPMEIVLRWAEELAEMSDYGITILDASFPEMLEITGKAQPELFMAALRDFMKGGKKLPPAMSALSAPAVKELRATFAESSLRILVA